MGVEARFIVEVPSSETRKHVIKCLDNYFFGPSLGGGLVRKATGEILLSSVFLAPRGNDEIFFIVENGV